MTKIYGCIDKETEQKHLEEWPLKEGWERHYTDHTGRFFTDIDPNAPVDPLEKEVYNILQDEINKEVNKSIIEKICVTSRAKEVNLKLLKKY